MIRAKCPIWLALYDQIVVVSASIQNEGLLGFYDVCGRPEKYFVTSKKPLDPKLALVTVRILKWKGQNALVIGFLRANMNGNENTMSHCAHKLRPRNIFIAFWVTE